MDLIGWLEEEREVWMFKTKNDEPREFLKHAPSAIGDFLVHAAGCRRVDFALAEFLFGGVEAWMMGCG